MTLFGEKLLPPLSTWLLLAVFTVTYYVAVTFYVRFRYLRFIPGPKWAGYSRLWLLRTLASGDSAWRFLEVNKKYGRSTRAFSVHYTENTNPELVTDADNANQVLSLELDQTIFSRPVPALVGKFSQHDHLMYGDLGLILLGSTRTSVV